MNTGKTLFAQVWTFCPGRLSIAWSPATETTIGFGLSRAQIISASWPFHMADPLASADPRKSVAVFAPAGTGKTWLLVARILRLLLAGAEPDSILTICQAVRK